MKSWKIMLMLLILLTILSMGCVCASDEVALDNIVGDDVNLIAVNVNDVGGCDDVDIVESNGADETSAEEVSVQQDRGYENKLNVVSDSFENVKENVEGGSVLEKNDTIDLNFQVPDVVYKYFGSEDLGMYAPKDANGVIEVHVDNKYVTTINKVQKNYYPFDFVYSNLNEGNHSIDFRFRGDSFYKDVNKTYNFEVRAVSIYIPDEVISEGISWNNWIKVAFPDDTKGFISVFVDGKLREKFSTDKYRRNNIDDYRDDYEFEMYSYEYCYYDLSDLPFKEYEIEVKFDGDPKYNSVSKKIKCNSTYNMYVFVDDDCIYDYHRYLQDISILLPEDIKSVPMVKIDGKKYKVKYDELSSSFLVNVDSCKLPIGNHTVVVTYADAKYPLKTFTGSINVYGKILLDTGYGIEHGDYELYVGMDSIFFLKLPADAKGQLVAYVSENNDTNGTLIKKVNFKNGSASISVDDLILGKYYLSVKYNGSDYNVDDVNVPVEIYLGYYYPDSMKYGENKYLAFKSVKSDNRLLSVKLNGKLYGTFQLINGQGKISLNKLPLGKNLCLDVYSSDENIFSTFISVNPATKLTGGKNIKMHYNDGTKYSVKIYDKYGKMVGEGKVVTFKIGNKNYKAKTNAKSIAYLKITNNPGKYTIAANYDGVKVSNKIVVKHVLSLNNVNVKKSAKKLVLKATLKQGQNVLKNKKVVFKFNGKKFTSKTNKKGVAKVTIKKGVLKKLKEGKKVKYQATYLKDTVKKASKVKK